MNNNDTDIDAIDENDLKHINRERKKRSKR